MSYQSRPGQSNSKTERDSSPATNDSGNDALDAASQKKQERLDCSCFFSLNRRAGVFIGDGLSLRGSSVSAGTGAAPQSGKIMCLLLPQKTGSKT